MARILNLNSDYNGDKDADICDSKKKKQSYVLFSDDIKLEYYPYDKYKSPHTLPGGGGLSGPNFC